MMRVASMIMFFLLLALGNANGQSPAINFHHLSVKNGLNDPMVNAICQDKYGYMWFASLGALNRFNGAGIKRFTNVSGDSTTPFNAVPYAMVCDSNGRLWVGYPNGLLEFDYETSDFRRVHAFNGITIYSIAAGNDGQLFFCSSNGFLWYDPILNKFQDCSSPGDTLTRRLMDKTRIYDIKYNGGLVYAGCYNGYIIFDPKIKKAKWFSVAALNGVADKILADGKGGVWLSNYKNARLIRVGPSTGQISILDSLLLSPPRAQITVVADMLADEKNIWLLTSMKGLIQYDLETGKSIHHRYNRLLPNSLSANNLRTIYISKDGTVWVNSHLGIDYFHPQKNFFQVLLPFDDEKAFNYARGLVEDKKGIFWFATGDGLSKYDPRANNYTYYRNQQGRADVIHYNSVRAVVDDAQDNIWIATGRGVNFFNAQTGKMQFLDSKDSLPTSFYFSANRDKKNRVWLGTRDYDGFYFYDPAVKGIRSMASLPPLRPFRGMGGRYVFEDSRNRLWFGFNGNGVLMYDQQNGKTRHWINDGKKTDSTITGNLIVDIKEDKNGVIWISSFGGLTGIDLEKEKYYLFNEKNGLSSNNVGPIAVDELNRLWIGTANGLMLLDSNRKNLISFTEEDGLPSLNFTEHPGHYTSEGTIMFPTSNGYVRFNPLAIRSEKESFNFFIAGIRVFNKLIPGNFNLGKKRLRLPANQNFITVEFEALNYLNTGKIWYAYRLDGVDKDWNYTTDPKAVYTNLQGGRHLLRYKASLDLSHWDLPEKTLAIHVGTIFYKSWWFYLALVTLLFALFYWIYRSRLSNQAKLHRLQSRAQLLEKEKALVMYESLKQQLNPHFLFNSLTSLSGLIETDQKMAGNFLAQMSKIYRYILKNRDSELVTLSEEINFVQSYIDLQKTRFKNGLQVKITGSSEYDQKKIAPVTLQNLIENAIKHNIIDQDTPLIIEIFTDNGYLLVRNNLQKKHMVETSNQQGLLNLRTLYQYLTDKPVIIKEDNSHFLIGVPLIGE